MRFIYSFAWGLVLPVALARLWWRGRREPGYRQHVAERLGFYVREGRDAAKPPVIWVHAVSVGETRAAEPLVHALLDAYPEHHILLTHMTATGRATGKMLFASHMPRVVQCYLPYDIGWMMRRFITRFSPQLCVLMETEVWPNLIAQCQRQRVPVALVNARLSQRSLDKAKRLPALMGAAARGISCVGAQTEADAQRIRQLGVAEVQVTGSIKFDVTPPPALLDRGNALRRRIDARPVLLCASTREGEEALILDALLKSDAGDALVVLVPRHPQRFDEVARLIAERGLPMCRRSEMGDGDVAGDCRVLLGDSMGEMFAYYQACDAAFIGGSLLPLGGQNLIEACALGKPVLLGPHTFNFGVVSEDAIAAGAALRVEDATDMLKQGLLLLRQRERLAAMGEQALAFAHHHRGATARTMDLLRAYLE